MTKYKLEANIAPLRPHCSHLSWGKMLTWNEHKPHASLLTLVLTEHPSAGSSLQLLCPMLIHHLPLIVFFSLKLCSKSNEGSATQGLSKLSCSYIWKYSFGPRRGCGLRTWRHDAGLAYNLSGIFQLYEYADFQIKSSIYAFHKASLLCCGTAVNT